MLILSSFSCIANAFIASKVRLKLILRCTKYLIELVECTYPVSVRNLKTTLVERFKAYIVVISCTANAY